MGRHFQTQQCQSISSLWQENVEMCYLFWKLYSLMEFERNFQFGTKTIVFISFKRLFLEPIFASIAWWIWWRFWDFNETMMKKMKMLMIIIIIKSFPIYFDICSVHLATWRTIKSLSISEILLSFFLFLRSQILNTSILLSFSQIPDLKYFYLSFLISDPDPIILPCLVCH